MDLMSLKNGTDIRGVAISNKDFEINLNKESIEKIAKGFYIWLKNKFNKDNLTITIGHDSRLSNKTILNILTNTLINLGVNVIVTNLSSTPSMFMILQEENYDYIDASIMITASHLPYYYNGLKFFTKKGGLEGEDIKNILTYASNEISNSDKKGYIKEIDYLSIYSMNLVNKFRKALNEEKPLKNIHIVVDAGNGAGGFYANKVLKELGADISGSQFLDPDGNFPNHIPNPENKIAMKSISDAVIKSDADFGIIFDTDVDRAACVDKNGKEINRNNLIALISSILLSEKKGTIVTDSVTSNGLKTFIEERGGKHHRFKRGYRNVINEAIRLNNNGEYTPLAIETSGHAALLENYFLDDGAYLITRILISLAIEKKNNREITDLIKELKEPLESLEIRPKFLSNNFKDEGNLIINELKELVNKNKELSIADNNYEGVRINFNNKEFNGWALVRLSLHEPILPINIESDIKGGSKKIAVFIYNFLKKYNLNLDCFNLIVN